jgi:hypothetical protein
MLALGYMPEKGLKLMKFYLCRSKTLSLLKFSNSFRRTHWPFLYKKMLVGS